VFHKGHALINDRGAFTFRFRAGIPLVLVLGVVRDWWWHSELSSLRDNIVNNDPTVVTTSKNPVHILIAHRCHILKRRTKLWAILQTKLTVLAITCWVDIAFLAQNERVVPARCDILEGLLGEILDQLGWELISGASQSELAVSTVSKRVKHASIC